MVIHNIMMMSLTMLHRPTNCFRNIGKILRVIAFEGKGGYSTKQTICVPHHIADGRKRVIITNNKSLSLIPGKTSHGGRFVGNSSLSFSTIMLRCSSFSHHQYNQSRLITSSSKSTSTYNIQEDVSNPINWEKAVSLLKAEVDSLIAAGLPTDSNQSQELKDLALQLSDYFVTGGKIPIEFMDYLLDVSILRHKMLPNVIPVQRSVVNSNTGERGTVVVVGDTHGQYLDFHQIIQDRLGGTPCDDNRYVINGDIVDRGSMSVEILAVLLTFKLSCDTSVTILRGNHETTLMNKHYGFESEVMRKFNSTTLEKFRALFDTLPFAAVIEESIFVVHGGIGQLTANMTIDELNKVDRQLKANDNIITELLWSDPREDIKGCKKNTHRGCGQWFGSDITAHFLNKIQMQMLIRSHQVRKEGYGMMHDNRLMTLFSAPNYCNREKNLGAIVKIESNRGNELNESNKDEALIAIYDFKSVHYPLEDKM